MFVAWRSVKCERLFFRVRLLGSLQRLFRCTELERKNENDDYQKNEKINTRQKWHFPDCIKTYRTMHSHDNGRK